MNRITPDTHIIIKGARVHNLKNIDVAIEEIKSLLLQEFQVRENHHWLLTHFLVRDKEDM